MGQMDKTDILGTNMIDTSANRASAGRRFFSTDLFRGAREIIIEHCGQHYRLQITKAGKLILNK